MDWALWISVLSLAVSGTVAYRTELRGPKVELRFLAAPRTWEVHVRAQKSAGKPTGAPLGEYDPIPVGVLDVRLFGDADVSVANDGSQDGLLWDLTFTLDPLPDCWGGGASQRGQPRTMIPVDKKGQTPLPILISLQCNSVNFRTALRLLVEAPAGMKLTAHYKANRGWLRRAARGHAELDIPRNDLSDALRKWVAAGGRMMEESWLE